VAQGVIKVPALGTANIGGPCPTIRDFRIVDQDQSDNSLTAYCLLNGGTMVAQATPANAGNCTLIVNGSDNRLIDAFIDPAVGCTPWMLPSLTAPGGMTSGIVTNELLAASHQAAPVAEVPVSDPMVLNNGQFSLTKTNLYRSAVGQTPLKALDQAMPLQYCNNITAGGIFAAANQALFTNNPSPMPDVANNLYTFLAQRFAAAINDCNLNCMPLWGITVNPVTLTLDGNGVVTAATINVQVLQKLGMGLTASNATASSTTMSTMSSTMSTVTLLPTTSSSSSFVKFQNTTRASATATVAASSTNSIVSLSSNGNKGATFTASTTLATMTVAATNTKTNVNAGSSTAVAVGGGTGGSSSVVGGGTGSSTSVAVGGGTGTTATGVAVGGTGTTATCSCPALAPPTGTAAAAPCAYTVLSNGLLKNVQTNQLYVPLPAFVDNFLESKGGF
jgi:hypothetical protein